MKCGHLFNGIGGFPLAASWLGWENIMHCEIDPFCNRVMNFHFPNSFQHEDIRTTDFRIWRGRIDLITGGFPCQPYSTAGKRKGTADDRHLWPEMLRAIREISPRWIVAENVRGLTNWNGGMVFNQVQADMEAEGYEVIPFLLPAAGVGAPHRRDRIWFVAHSKIGNGNLSKGTEHREKEMDIAGDGCEGITTNTNGHGFGSINRFEQIGCTKNKAEGEEQRKGWDKIQRQRNGNVTWRVDSAQFWQNFPTVAPVCNGNDGLSFRLADITVPSKKYGQRVLTGKQAYGRWRKESLTALGNAIVPEVAYELFKAIEQYENL